MALLDLGEPQHPATRAQRALEAHAQPAPAALDLERGALRLQPRQLLAPALGLSRLGGLGTEALDEALLVGDLCRARCERCAWTCARRSCWRAT
jgi:hypothetical protein